MGVELAGPLSGGHDYSQRRSVVADDWRSRHAAHDAPKLVFGQAMLGLPAEASGWVNVVLVTSDAIAFTVRMNSAREGDPLAATPAEG